MRKVLMISTILAFLLIPIQTAHAEGITFENGVVSYPLSKNETQLFAQLTLSSADNGNNGIYQISGTVTANSYNGGMVGVYDSKANRVTGEYSYFVFDDTTLPDGSAGAYMLAGTEYDTYTLMGNFEGSVSQSGTCTLTLTGTITTTHYNWKIDKDKRLIYKDCVQSQNTTDKTRTVTFVTQPVERTQAPLPSPSPILLATQTPTVVKVPSRDSGIRFSDLTGEVEVCFPLGYDENGRAIYNEEAWENAELDTVMPYGTKIKTRNKSGFFLSFPDMTTFRTQESGTWILPEDPAVDPDIVNRPNTLELLWGQMKTNVQHMMKDGTMDIEMSQAVMGIKGTTFVLEEDGVTSKVMVIEGTVTFTAKSDGKTVTVNSGEMISATVGGLSEKTSFNVEAELAKWEEIGFDPPQTGMPLWLILLCAGGIIVVSVIALILFSKRKKAQMICQESRNNHITTRR